MGHPMKDHGMGWRRPEKMNPIRCVPCPTCGALAGLPCSRSDGDVYKAFYHPARVEAAGVPRAGQ
jgi:hypothetical protein